MFCGHMSPDGARDDIARRKLRAGRIRHETIAVFVDESRTFAAHRFADQFQREGAGIERGRMKLDKFKIGHSGAGARRER